MVRLSCYVDVKRDKSDSYPLCHELSRRAPNEFSHSLPNAKELGWRKGHKVFNKKQSGHFRASALSLLLDRCREKNCRVEDFRRIALLSRAAALVGMLIF